MPRKEYPSFPIDAQEKFEERDDKLKDRRYVRLLQALVENFSDESFTIEEAKDAAPPLKKEEGESRREFLGREDPVASRVALDKLVVFGWLEKEGEQYSLTQEGRDILEQ